MLKIAAKIKTAAKKMNNAQIQNAMEISSLQLYFFSLYLYFLVHKSELKRTYNRRILFSLKQVNEYIIANVIYSACFRSFDFH